MNNLKKGFSLVELLVVIAIIGILASVGVTTYSGYIESAKQGLEDFKRIRLDSLSPAAKQFEKLGAFKEPAILAGGALAAVGTAAVAKKLFQKAEQERIKKEDPLQYKKYKRGDYTKE